MGLAGSISTISRNQNSGEKFSFPHILSDISCLPYIPKFQFQFQVFSDFVKIDPMLSLAICIDSDTNVVWKKRDPEDIIYNNLLLDTDMLFPERLDPEDEQWSERVKQEMDDSKNNADDENYGEGEVDKELDDGAIMDRDEDPDYKPMKRKRKIKMDPDSEYTSLAPTGKRRGRPPKSGGSSSTIKTPKAERIKKEGVEKKKKIKLEDPSKERYLCLKCGQTVAQSHGKKHEARCTGMHVRHPEYKKVGEEFWCTVDGCNIGYGFNSVYGLRKHFHGVHVRDEEKYFACDYCEERFSFLTTKNKHMKMKHIKPHICDICGKGFGFRNKLHDHRLIHTGEKPYQCDKCDYRASKKGNLDAHKIDKHGDFGGNKNFICAMCNKQFTTMGRVRRHMEIMHAEGKEESARVRRQRQKLAQATAAQGIGLPGILAENRFKKQREEEEAARPAVVHMVPVVQQQVVADGQVIHSTVQQDEQDAAVQFLESDLYH